MISNELQTKFWSTVKMDTINAYWISPPATKRSLWFCDVLKNYDFDSVMEIGFLSGRNLKYIKDVFPIVSISGIEVNHLAVEFARNKLPECDLVELDLHNLPQLNKKADLVFTSGVLIHITPNELENAVRKIADKANKYVMHMEQLGSGDVCAGPKELKPSYKVSNQIQWNQDLVGVYRKIGYEPEVIELPADVRTNGARELLVVKL
ncbi:MAG: methyltransferase domain-containing protein [Patescibacteria group bacterium]